MVAMAFGARDWRPQLGLLLTIVSAVLLGSNACESPRARAKAVELLSDETTQVRYGSPSAVNALHSGHGNGDGVSSLPASSESSTLSAKSASNDVARRLGSRATLRRVTWCVSRPSQSAIEGDLHAHLV